LPLKVKRKNISDKNKEKSTVVNNSHEYLQHAEKKIVGKLEMDMYNSDGI